MGSRLNAFRKLLILGAITSSLFAQAAQESAAPTPVEVSAAEEQSHLLKHVAPNYPPLARQARIQGTVFVHFEIDKSGSVQNLRLISGHPMLAPAAIEAVRQWQYEPYIIDGNAVTVQTSVEVKFALDGGPSNTPAALDGIVGTTPTTTPRIAAPTRVRVSSGVSAGLLMTKVNPVYPKDARRARIQGSVIMQAIIDKEGNVATLELVSGHPALVDAAMEAVRKWKYQPYLLNGQPVEVQTQMQVNFTLTPN
jgi:TonB family protein